MNKWQGVDNIPVGVRIRVKTVTGIECDARHYGIDGRPYICPARYPLPKRAPCIRLDGRTSGDVSAIRWKSIE